MSRGPGAVERGILDALAESRWSRTAADLADHVFQPGLDPARGFLSPTASQIASVRRALRRLVARGTIVEARKWQGQATWRLAAPKKAKGKRDDSSFVDFPSATADAALAQRFAKILGYLSSDHAGERANAVAAAEKLRQDNRLTWADIVRGAIAR